MTGNGLNQMQVVLNLTVPTLEAGLVQWMVVSCISSLGREKQVKTSVPSPNFSVLRVNNSLKQGLRSRTMNPLSIGDISAQQGSGEAEGVDTEAANSLPAAANHGHPLPCEQQVVSPSRAVIGAGVPQTEVFSQGEIQRLKHFTRQG